MDLTKYTNEQIKILKEIAAKMNTTLEELLKDHHDVNTLIESYNGQEFGMLNEYEKSGQVLNG